MTKRYLNGADWAQWVSEQEPHQLADLEAHVLDRAQYTIARAGYRKKFSLVRAGEALKNVLRVAVVLGPIAGVVIFWNRENAVFMAFSYGPDVALPVAAIGFGLGLILIVTMIVEWWQKGRRRESFTTWFAMVLLALAATALLLGYGEVPGETTRATLFLLPAWLTGAGALLLIVANLGADRPDPDVQAPAPQPEAVGDLADLSRADAAAVLDDRRRALEILASRGMLTGGDVEELARRPLGALATGEGGRT